MRVLREVLRDCRGEIIASFANRVRAARLLPDSMPQEQVIDSLPELLDALAIASETHTPGEVLSLAKEHAIQRLRLGFGIHELVLEYALLRELIVHKCEGRGLDVEGLAAFLRIMSESVAAGVEEYALVREREGRSQAERHFAFIAHELRNPLTSVRLALDRLRKNAQRVSAPSLPEGARPSLAGLLGDDAYDTIDRGIRKLQDLIDNSLVKVKLNALADAESIAKERVELRALADELLEDVRGDAGDKKIGLACSMEAGLCTLGDRRILYSALSNLVRNAIKFTRPGGTVELRGHEVEAGLVIEVEDGCGGLAKAAMDKLFDPFVQVGADRSGFGLGLAITRHAAEAHGGSIGVRNVEGKGCVFVLTLPKPASSSNRSRSVDAV